MADIITALGLIAEPFNFVCLIFGVGVGIMFGAMPGLSVNMGLALLLPLAFAFKGMAGILMLLGIYCGAIYGGSISAILLKTPGTPASVATTLDGYPMAVELRQPGRALGLSTTASAFGGIFSTICLIICAPLLAKISLQFSKPEYFALAVFGLSIITSVSSGNVLKGIMGGIIGLFLATVGIDAMSGAIRFTLDTTYLLGGVSFIPILIGVFALAQMLQSVEDCWQKSQLKQHVTIHKVLPSMADLKRCFVTMLRSSAIGTFIGCIPGTGGDIASFVSYDQAKRWSKHSENFGHGEPEGVAAPEAGNNAVSGGAFIPVLTLGIPGDGATAIMMGALMVQGLQPGPLLFIEKAPDVYAIFIGLLLANIIMACMGHHYADDLCGDLQLREFHDGRVCDGGQRVHRIFSKQAEIFHERHHHRHHLRRYGRAEFCRIPDYERRQSRHLLHKTYLPVLPGSRCHIPGCTLFHEKEELNRNIKHKR